MLTCALVLGGCSTVKGWFTDKTRDVAEPAELVDFPATAKVERLWSVQVGEGEGRLGSRQGPAIADGRVYAAALEGGVGAWDLQTGNALWRAESELRLSGSPGVGDGTVVVGGLEGDVTALDAATGAQKWTAQVGTEILAAPAVGQGYALVRSIDGRVTAFDLATGERRWFWERETPTLTVRGNASPLLGPGLAFIASDDGSLAAISLATGRLLWEQTVALGEGRTELDRMADIDGTPVLDEIVLFATSYKKRTMAIDGPSGRPIWAHDAGGAGKAGVSADRVVVSDAQGIVWGLGKFDGSALWQQPALSMRRLTGVAIHSDYAVVGDFEGYLHWLQLSDGAFAARAEAAGEAFRAALVVSDGVLVAQATDGSMSAWRIAP
ncbi:MAG: outer membrane protein assembly factor BamB [Pseudomonadota bacterium]|nr:outer membrane protein assembly factor BamB [Pseudomonadota bacterium]